MSITAVVENNTIKLPVNVPDGTTVEVTIPEQDSAKPRQPGLGKDVFVWMSDDFAEPLPDDIWEHNKD